MSWVYLLIAIGLEVSGTTCMKLSQGFSRPGPSALIFVFYAFSILFLTLAVHRLDISIAYAVWSGVGTALMVVIGIAWFGEALTVVRATAVAFIIVGVVAAHMSS